MNNIIDIPDRSPGSHLDLFNDTHQEQIIKALSIEKLEKITLNLQHNFFLVQVVVRHRMFRK